MEVFGRRGLGRWALWARVQWQAALTAVGSVAGYIWRPSATG